MSNELFKAIMVTVMAGIILLYFQYKFFEPIQQQPSDNKIEIEIRHSLLEQARIGAETQANTEEERRRREPKVEQLILSIDRTMKVDRGYNTLNHQRIIKEIIVIDTQTRHIEKEIQQLKKYRVAYHYLIGPYGRVKLLVEESNVAIHTRARNEHSIGIGIIHVSGEEYSSLQIDSLISLLANIVNRYNIRLSMIRASSQVAPKKKSDLPYILNNIRERVRTMID